MLKKEDIIKLLQTDDRAVIRALLVLHDRQTTDEQSSEDTRYHNGVGFKSCDARMGSSMAKFFQRNGYLTPKQISYWRKLDKRGNMRIAAYWKQLLAAAEEKTMKKVTGMSPAARAADTEQSDREYIAQRQARARAAERDLGNDMERRAVLQEQLYDVLDSDDPKLIDPIKEEIDKIDAYWAKVR